MSNDALAVPVRPDSSDSSTAAIQSHLHRFFAAVMDAHGPAVPGCFRCISRQPHPFGNAGLVGPGVGAGDVERLARPLADDGFPSAVILEGGDDEAQAQPLKQLGFFFAESMCLMSATREQLRATALPDGYRFMEVGAEDDARWCDAFAAGYEIPTPLAAMFAPSVLARRADGARAFAIERDGSFAAVSACATIDGRPGIYAVATRPEHRGKGLGAHATAEALRNVWRDVPGDGVLQSSAMGEPVYRRIGFQSHGHMALYVRIPGAAAG